ncbi:MAG: hypothetical protein ACKVOK_10175 [Flavobacteriales bacterium]
MSIYEEDGFGGPTGSPNIRVPFLAWNRLEGEPRTENLDRALRAETYDATWMLSKQWQMGEFDAEDGGSAILARVAYSATSPSHFAAGKSEMLSAVQPDGFHFPSSVQKIRRKLNVQQRAHLGTCFLKLCKTYSSVTSSIITSLCSTYGFPEISSVDENNWNINIADTKKHADKKLMQFTRMYKGRVPDGEAIYFGCGIPDTGFSSLITALGVSDWNNLKNEFQSMVTTLYPHISIADEAQNWNHEDLGFSFRMAYPVESDGGLSALQLGNDTHDQGIADWNSADYMQTTAANLQNPIEEMDLGMYKRQQAFSVIPVSARFKGMPSKRWWEMEDASIDLGKSGSEMNEAIKQIIAEFATVYSNDWMVLPFRRKELELVNIDGVLVKDVFGEYTYLSNALTGTDNDLDTSAFDWNMFHHTSRLTPTSTPANSAIQSLHSCFVSGSSRMTVSGEELERIEFIRDEMDNRVWAIESLLADAVSGSRNGMELSDELQQFIDKLVPVSVGSESPYPLRYHLIDSISENYIPFIPVKTDPNIGTIPGRSIALQRAWLPRRQSPEATESRIRPRSQVLRHKLTDLDTPIVGNSRYVLKEELIPRSGLTLTDRYCYARDYKGKIHLWISRDIRTGTTANSGDLGYDRVIYKNQEQL